MPDSPSAGPSTGPLAMGSGSGNTYGASFPPESMGTSSHAYPIQYDFPEMGIPTVIILTRLCNQQLCLP